MKISVRHWSRLAVRRVSPVCAFALGLWAGLTLLGCASSAEGALSKAGGAESVEILLIGIALASGALAISLGMLPPARSAASLFLVGALCCGLATAAAISRYQAQRALPCEPSPGSSLSLRALEGALAIDSQSTASGNRRLDLDVGAAEWSGKGCQIRAEWGRAVFSAEVLTGPLAREHAGTNLRSASLRPGAFLWANMEEVSTLRQAGPIADFRGALADRFAEAIHTCAGRAGPLAQALLLGVKDELDGEYRSLFQAAGCAHLLALSGQHLAIICAFVALTGKRISRKPKLVRRVSIGFAWAFVWLAGPGPSLMRALFMLSVSELARALDRPQTGFSVLALASVLLALFAPSSINSLSSVFSFGAMAGLIGLSARFSARLRPWLPKPAADGLAASAAAVCATAPISILSFGTFVPAGILSATAAAPVMLAFMWIALGGSIVALMFPSIALVTKPALELLERALISVLELGAWFPAPAIGESPLARIGAVAVIATLAALLYAVRRMKSGAVRARLERARARLRPADAKSRLALLDARER